MANLSGVVEQLKKAHAEAQGEVKRLGAALAALGNLTGRGPTRKRRTPIGCCSKEDQPRAESAMREEKFEC